MKPGIQSFFLLTSLIIVLSSCSFSTKTIPLHNTSLGDERLGQGNILLKRGENNNAAVKFLKAYKTYSLTDDNKGCASSLTGLAVSLSRQDRHKDAEIFLEKAEYYWKEAGNKDELSSFYITKSLLILNTGDIDKAEKIIEKANDNNQDTRFIISQAMIQIKKQNLEKAEALIKKADKSEPDSNSYYFYTRALLEYKQKKYSHSQKNYLKALEIDKKTGDSPKIASDLEGLFCLHKDWGKIKKAENYLLRAMKIYTLMDNSSKTDNLTKELKKLKKDKNSDLSVENYFLQLWKN